MSYLIKQRLVSLVDLDAFFAAVEVLERPNLRDLPVLIGGNPSSRGVVAAASYEARKFGVHSAMPMSQAVRLCPQAVVLRPRFDLYRQYSRKVMAILRTVTKELEQTSIDEAYLELTSVITCAMEAEQIMRGVQRLIIDRVGLTCSVGLGSNKLIAKMACEAAKPAGFLIVSPGGEEDFLIGKPVEKLPGIGPASAERLKMHDWGTIDKLACAPLNILIGALGQRGAVLQSRARGEDASPVRPRREAKSISGEETFAQDVGDSTRLFCEMKRIAGEITKALHQRGLVARTVTLKLRYADFTTITRSMSQPYFTSSEVVILESARELLGRNWSDGQLVRLIGVGVSNLSSISMPGQLAFGQIAEPD